MCLFFFALLFNEYRSLCVEIVPLCAAERSRGTPDQTPESQEMSLGTSFSPTSEYWPFHFSVRLQTSRTSAAYLRNTVLCDFTVREVFFEPLLTKVKPLRLLYAPLSCVARNDDEEEEKEEKVEKGTKVKRTLSSLRNRMTGSFNKDKVTGHGACSHAKTETAYMM